MKKNIIPEITKNKENLNKCKKLFYNIFNKYYLKSIARSTNADDQRERKLNIASFTFLMILGQSLGYKINYQKLANCAVEWKLTQSDKITKQRISQQVEERGPEYFENLYHHIYQEFSELNRNARRKLKRYFKNVYAVDSTTIELVNKMVKCFIGTTGQPAIKLHTRFDLINSTPNAIEISDAKQHDSNYPMENEKENDVLYLKDLGYYAFDLFRKINETNNYFISRTKSGLVFKIIDNNKTAEKMSGHCLNDLLEYEKEKTHPDKYIDLQIELSSGLITRLVGCFDTDEKAFKFYLTNLDYFDWSAEEIMQLYKKRWTIEIFFRNFKIVMGNFKIISKSANRIKSQIWASLVYYLFVLLYMVIYSIVHNVSFSRLSFKKCSALLFRLIIKNDFGLKLKFPPEMEKILENILKKSDNVLKNINRSKM